MQRLSLSSRIVNESANKFQIAQPIQKHSFETASCINYVRPRRVLLRVVQKYVSILLPLSFYFKSTQASVLQVNHT